MRIHGLIALLLLPACRDVVGVGSVGAFDQDAGTLGGDSSQGSSQDAGEDQDAAPLPPGTGNGEPAARCTVSACAKQDLGCDPVQGVCVPCSDADPSSPEVFVDVAATGLTNPKGTAACPFPTIQAGLDRANRALAVKRVRVAKGTYSQEKLPLVVRGVELIGAGSGETEIRRSGSPEADAAGRKAVLAVGSSAADTTIRGLRVTTAESISRTSEDWFSYVGVLCDAGPINEPNPTKLPEPNTFITDFAVEAGFGVGVFTTSSPLSLGGRSACYPRIQRSTFQVVNGVAIAADCPGAKGGLAPCAVEIGGGSEDAVLIEGSFTPPALRSRAIEVQGNVRFARISHVVAKRLYFGALFGDAGPTGVNAWTIMDSAFEANHYGIWLDCSSQLQELRTSRFRDNEVAIVFGTGAYCKGASRAAILRARSNELAFNTVGLHAGPGMTATSDFGGADPGRNVFACNGLKSHPTLPSGDVAVYSDTPGLFSLAGNDWDRVPEVTVSADPPTTRFSLWAKAAASIGSIAGAGRANVSCTR